MFKFIILLYFCMTFYGTICDNREKRRSQWNETTNIEYIAEVNDSDKRPPYYDRGEWHNRGRGPPPRNWRPSHHRGPPQHARGPPFDIGLPSFYRGSPALDREPPAFDREPPAFDREPPAFDREPSAFDREIQVFDRGPLLDNDNRGPTPYENRPPFEDRQPPDNTESSFRTISQINNESLLSSFIKKYHGEFNVSSDQHDYDLSLNYTVDSNSNYYNDYNDDTYFITDRNYSFNEGIPLAGQKNKTRTSSMPTYHTSPYFFQVLPVTPES